MRRNRRPYLPVRPVFLLTSSCRMMICSRVRGDLPGVRMASLFSVSSAVARRIDPKEALFNHAPQDQQDDPRAIQAIDALSPLFEGEVVGTAQTRITLRQRRYAPSSLDEQE